MFTYTFAAVTSATGSQLDTVLNQAGLLGTVPCMVAGTNTLTLTPYSTPTVGTPPFALQPQVRLSGIAANTNTGVVTVNGLSVYKDTTGGPVALAGGEIHAGNYVVFAYDAVLNSGNGGWHLENSLSAGAPTGAAGGDLGGTFPNPSVNKIAGVALGDVTATSGAVMVGSGSAWVKKSISGDGSLSSAGALTITKTNGTNLTGLATATYVAPTAWTPADGSGAGLSFSGVSATYTRLANMIFASFSLTYPVTADTSNTILSGLPIAVPNQTYAQGPAAIWVSGGAIPVILVPIANTSTGHLLNQSSGAAVTNANLSGLTLRGLLIYPAS